MKPLFRPLLDHHNRGIRLDYVRKTVETLQTQTHRRKSVVEKNDQRTDIDEVMGEGGGDEEEVGESEDDNEDGEN